MTQKLMGFPVTFIEDVYEVITKVLRHNNNKLVTPNEISKLMGSYASERIFGSQTMSDMLKDMYTAGLLVRENVIATGTAIRYAYKLKEEPERTYAWNPGVYRHYKNKQLYLLLGDERDRTNASSPSMLSYMALYPNPDGQYLHRRTYANFFEVTDAKGQYGESLRRFEPVPRIQWVAELTDPRYYNMVQAFLMIHGKAFE